MKKNTVVALIVFLILAVIGMLNSENSSSGSRRNTSGSSSKTKTTTLSDGSTWKYNDSLGIGVITTKDGKSIGVNYGGK